MYNRLTSATALLALVWVGATEAPGQTGPSAGLGAFAGWATNGPAVFRLYARMTQTIPGPAVSYPTPSTNMPVEFRRGLLMFRAFANVTVIMETNKVLDHLLPESLNWLVWTNVIAHTNAKSTVIWNVRSHPEGWPGRPPIVEWNPNSLMWGMKGLTALSPCWEWEGNPGQVPITALTRRHGYTRGHSMGLDRVGTRYAGRKVWFVTRQNTVVEMRIKREVVRTGETSKRDYTIVLFGSDLPPSIEPIRVMDPGEIFAIPRSKYAYVEGAPCPIFQTEQGGNVSAGLPGLTLNTVKGGDSGSPNMLPMPGELVFFSGRTTSRPSPQMQADMDTLCRLEGLDPREYQLQWVDLSQYPTYSTN